MSEPICRRCGAAYDAIYCTACKSCQECLCCPCYRVGCEECSEGGRRDGETVEQYKARVNEAIGQAEALSEVREHG